MARKVELSSAMERIRKEVEKKRLKIEAAATIAVNKALETVSTKSSEELEEHTGYKKAYLRKKNKIYKAKKKGHVYYGRIVFSTFEPRLNVLQLKGTSVKKGSGPQKNTTRTKKGGRKKTKSRPGTISYTILGKRIKRKGIVIEVNKNKNKPEGDRIAVGYMKKDGKYRRGKKVKKVKSGKHTGKTYTSAKVFKLTGPNVHDVFNYDEFREEIQTFSDQEIDRYVDIEFRKKRIFTDDS